MYICKSCGALLEAPIPIPEYHNELEGSPIEVFYGCSRCHSTDIEQAVQCDLCGNYVDSHYVTLSDGTVACVDCYVLHE